jgi:hypothetical protein
MHEVSGVSDSLLPPSRDWLSNYNKSRRNKVQIKFRECLPPFCTIFLNLFVSSVKT